MINIINEKDCCGCAACAAVCPEQCITMQPGTLGAIFPHVDAEKCLHCGLCEEACPMKQELPKVSAFQETAYAAYALDSATRFAASSGGLFPVLAQTALENDSVVYGAAFDEALQLKCMPATTIGELAPLLKSKYLQSDMQNRFAEIKELLQAGKQVLFTATPCQVAALKSFLGREYENLTTVDFFCHGVPSQAFFDRCRAYEENKSGCTMTGFSFREKIKNGATPHYFKVTYRKNGKDRSATKLYFHSAFYAAFQRYISLRESCYHCRYAGSVRCSDITIGDFHTIDRYIDGINRFDGVSTVIINSVKGQQLLDLCRDLLWLQQVDLNLLKKNGDCFTGGTKHPQTRERFLAALENEPFDRVMADWFAPRKYWKNSIYYHLPKMVRKVLYRLKFGD